MGLLDQFFGTPEQTQALGLLGAGMMAGRAPAGFEAALGLLSPDSVLARKLKEAQLGEYSVKNQMEQYQLKRLQEWDKLMNGGGDAPQFKPGDVTSPGAFITPGDGVGPTLPISSAPAALTQSSGFKFGLPGRSDQQSRAVAGSMTPDAYMKIYAEQTAPNTDITKLLTSIGVDPNSPIGRQMVADQISKQNYIAPVNARPGSILRDPRDPSKIVAFNPHVPDGSAPEFDGNGNVNSFAPINNSEEALRLPERARTYGKAEATPSVVYGPGGIPQFSTVARDITRAGGQQGAQSNFNLASGASLTPDLQSAILADAQKNGIANPQLDIRPPAGMKTATFGIQSQGQGVTPSLPPGVGAGAENAQTELSKKWQALNEANGQAEITKSYLQTIKQLSEKAATGPFTDKLQFTNAVLGLVGNEKATDAVTANNLLDKYSNQIVSRLGTGGLGTDAARAILQSAYPNAHMTKEAIAEAADNIGGASSMVQAKARLLQDAANSRNPTAYNQKEVTFDQNADPRLWQLSNMDAKSAQLFLSKMPPSVQADLRRKAANLKMIGAL